MGTIDGAAVQYIDYLEKRGYKVLDQRTDRTNLCHTGEFNNDVKVEVNLQANPMEEQHSSKDVSAICLAIMTLLDELAVSMVKAGKDPRSSMLLLGLLRELTDTLSYLSGQPMTNYDLLKFSLDSMSDEVIEWFNGTRTEEDK